MSTPLVSIGIPVYNGGAVLRRAIESVLDQTYQQLEVIVCDNGSIDDTEAICRGYASRDRRVRYVRNARNIGAIGNFRRVLDLSTGMYFTWTAADDYRPPRAIASCVEALERWPDAVMVHGPILAQLEGELTVEVGNRMDLASPSAYRRIRTFTRGLEHNAILYGLYRRRWLDSARLHAHYGHDYLFCLQACLLGPIAYTPAPIIAYHHRNDAVVGPMYAPVRPRLSDLLFHHGVRRRKCWMTWFLGACYLLGDRRIAPDRRIRAAAAHVSAFAARYARHMLLELVFLLFAPASWVFTPLAPAAVRAKASFRRGAHIAGSVTHTDVSH